MDTMIILLGLVFLLLLLLPVIVAYGVYRRREGFLLFINQEKLRDPRYFGRSFSGMIESAIGSLKDGETIRLSKDERVQDGASLPHGAHIIEDLVVTRMKEFAPDRGSIFRKEIYASGDVLLRDIKEFRAVYAKKNLIIGQHAYLHRWADALGTVAVYDKCHLGISVTSESRMSIGHDCTFRRLYAPEIFLGQYPDKLDEEREEKDPRIYRLEVQKNKERNIQYISDDRINEDGIVDFSVLTKKNVKVIEGIIVQGDIRSDKVVHLCDNAVVCGNVFAEGNVILGRNATVLGSVFSQENVILEDQATVGQAGRISSLIARGEILVQGRATVYGYISAEKAGRTASLGMEESSSPHPNQYLIAEAGLEKLSFSDPEDFNKIDSQGFRHHPFLKRIRIPEGVAMLKNSLFFQCRHLQLVQLPQSLTAIGDYAFSGCSVLKEDVLKTLASLKIVGVAAFEGCASMEEITIPASVEKLDQAAFKDCTGLRSLRFQEPSALKSIGSHCFQNCTALEELILPEGVEEVGLAAFDGCSSLRSLSLPAASATQPGIQGAALPEGTILIYDSKDS